MPFDNETFDFVMSIGVLHHIPDTQRAMQNCVDKVKHGGYFYTYLYYDLDNKGNIFKFIFFLSNLVRSVVSKFPRSVKKLVCDLLAIILYMPLVILGRS